MNRQGEDPDVVKEAVMDEVKKHFRPEFINRIDEIVVFNALDQKAIAKSPASRFVNLRNVWNREHRSGCD